MNSDPYQSRHFFNSDEVGENLWNYVQSLSPDMVNQLSQPESPEVLQVMERSIISLLGNLPPEHFGASISTSRENLGRLLASAMMSGYFIRNAEQRLKFEKSLEELHGLSPEDEND